MKSIYQQIHSNTYKDIRTLTYKKIRQIMPIDLAYNISFKVHENMIGKIRMEIYNEINI